MATYFIDPTNGNDADDGLSWANAFLTLNGCEDEPVAAGDTVYVGPGVYREMLIVDVSGAGGNPITYIADVTGENTDSVGGIVRITGSDNDQTEARVNCISGGGFDYRTFRGFFMDTVNAQVIIATTATNWVIEDCAFLNEAQSIYFIGAHSDITVRRCIFLGGKNNQYCVYFRDTAGIVNSSNLVQNCVFLGSIRAIGSEEVGGIAIENCYFQGSDHAIRVIAALPGGYTAITVTNSIFTCCPIAIRAINLGEIVEDHNTFYANGTDHFTVAVGGNSQTYPPLLLPPILHAGVSQISGFKFPWWFGELSEWSQIQAITGSNEPTEDLRGMARPVTASKNSWGPLQFADMERETGTVHAGSVSMVLHDAGRHQIWVPVEASSTTFEVYVYREANYAAGAASNPRMIIKQPGQADDITTDANPAAQWNLLTTTLVPAAIPPYVVVELISNNTAVAGNYKVFFDDLDVS